MSTQGVLTLTAPHGTVTVPTGLFIAGEWRQSSTGTTFDVVNPSDETVLGKIADATPSDAVAALDAATSAQQEWGNLTSRERSNFLRRVYELLTERSEDIAWVMSAEMGKPLAESRGEVAGSAAIFRFLSEQVTQQRGTFSEAPNGGFRIITTHSPVGPSYLITPWNFPLLMGARKVGAALAAGCTAILKPAALTPLSSHLFVQVLIDSGAPAGVINLVSTSSSSSQSKALMADERLRKISFTGSTQVGSTLLEQAAPNILSTSMELGGNGPFLVLANADVKKAAKDAVIAKFRNAGQVCVAANRIIVDKSIADEFRTEFIRQVEKLRVGAADKQDTEIGPLVDANQRESVQKVLLEAVRDGAELLCGGQKIDQAGFYMEPTVISGARRNSRISTDEIFGPVASIYEADGVNDAIQFANDTRFGLVAYLYTENTAEAISVAERIESGIVAINRPVVADPAAPFGGIKASGLGKEGGENGIREYQVEKYIALAV
ncbi:NAD-dependent succinate-semialdehyde dehydrogenase [Corynebacterium accolens]|uniref:NAD-dependent succinate-semialdehyde dehydrogenase n=1 Tax=Corynebacterium accolens TaxID=38284 RepID=UPI00266F5FAC|nr:NAD-dependent succinate-semialdehyde dehydrogenase [Corynebacterium accolens]WKS55395.1 NAD-dependent succinate-semialdehyde dehydrogenase [Corynebacterium accolens]